MSRSVIIVLSVLVAVGLAAGGYFVFKWLQKSESVNTPITQAQ